MAESNHQEEPNGPLTDSSLTVGDQPATRRRRGGGPAARRSQLEEFMIRPWPQQRARRTRWIALVLLVLAPVSATALTFWNVAAEDTTTVIEPQGNVDDAVLLVEATAVELDLQLKEMSFRLVFRPSGDIVRGNELTSDVTVFVSDISGSGIREFPAGSAMEPTTVVVELSGSQLRYPFDTYEADLGVGAAASSGAGQDPDPLTLDLEVGVALDQFDVVAADRRQDNAVSVELELQRRTAVIIWVLFFMFLVWSIALGGAAVAWFIVVFAQGSPVLGLRVLRLDPVRAADAARRSARLAALRVARGLGGVLLGHRHPGGRGLVGAAGRCGTSRHGSRCANSARPRRRSAAAPTPGEHTPGSCRAVTEGDGPGEPDPATRSTRVNDREQPLHPVRRHAEPLGDRRGGVASTLHRRRARHRAAASSSSSSAPLPALPHRRATITYSPRGVHVVAVRERFRPACLARVSSCSLVSSRHNATRRSGPSTSSQVGERARQSMGSLVEHHGALLPHQLGEARRAELALAGQEPLEAEPARIVQQPTADQADRRSEGAGHDLDAQAGVQGHRHQPGAGVRQPGHPGVARDGDQRTAADPLEQ